MGDHSFQQWQFSPERRSSHLSPSNYSHEHGDKPDEGKALIQTATLFPLKQTSLLSSEGHVIASFLFYKTRRAQNPNQPRLLSTSCNSWPSMSGAIWQLKATFATSQSCRKRAIVLSDPCSPMTNKAPLPTLFSLELLDEKEEPLSDHLELSSIVMCRPIKVTSTTGYWAQTGPAP